MKIPKQCVSGKELLEFSYTICSSQAPYGYRIEGERYGEKWACNLTREGAKMLAIAILEKL